MIKKKKRKIENEQISEDRKKYLKKIKINKIKVFTTQITIALAFIVIWEVLARMGKIDSFITSKPSRIWGNIFKLIIKRFVRTSKDYMYRNLSRIFTRNRVRNNNSYNLMAITIYF